MTKKGLVSLLLTVAVLLSPVAISAAADSESTEDDIVQTLAESADETEKIQIHISTVKELKKLADDCRLDVYSANLEVFLDNSIDLGSKKIIIPSFSGSFDGNGFTISGLSLSVSGDGKGLFGTIQQDGVVMNLKVEGEVSASEGSTRTGAVAGYNRGILLNCSFSGTVYGQSETGGVCGHNDGYLINCESEGNISGMDKTGGVCGYNSGNLIGCTNRAEVNTSVREDEETSTDITALSLLGLVTADSVNTSIDTGGIVGFSDRVVLRCENYGTVGYPTYGYNVGGIAGRQSNCISKCTNYGSVFGRNDVGGIAGHAEPYMQLEDRQTLSDEIRAVSDAFNTAMDNLDENSGITAEYIVSIGDNVMDIGRDYDGAVNDAGYYDDLEDKADDLGADVDIDGSIFNTTVNNQELDGYESIIDYSLSETSDAADNISADQVKEIVNTAQNNGDGQDNIEDTVSEAGDILGADTRTAVEAYSETSDEAVESAVKEKISQTEEMEDTVKEATSMDIEIDQEDAEALADGNAEDIDYEKYVDQGIEEAPDAVYNQADTISQQRAQRKTEEKQSSDDLTEDVAQITDDTNALEDNISAMGESVAKASDDLSEDLSEYNEHMTNALTMVANAMAGNFGMNLYNDISELNGNGSNNGKIMNCVNKGSVEGEMNTGGITGTMAIESEYDLEGIISDTLASEGIFSNTYKTTCIIENCINWADIYSSKSRCGGIAGDQTVGYLLQDENYGDINAEEYYAGGIAGKSGAIINTCYSGCDVCCKSYAGGIAGTGNVIIDCISLSSIPESVTSFRGAVAGQADAKATRSIDIETGILAQTVEALLPDATGDEGNESEGSSITAVDENCVTGNYFVSSSLGGINGISYTGIAEPVSYETVMNYAGLPENLKTKTILFRADGVTVKELKVGYGENISEKDIPPVPQKEGYTGIWPEFSTETVTKGGIVEAVYLPQLSTVESDAKRNESGLSVALLEGSFPVGTTVYAKQNTIAEIDNNTVYESWTVYPVMQGTETAYSVRYNLPSSADGHPSLYVCRDGDWQKSDYRTAGSYIEFDGIPGGTTFAVTEGSSPAVIIAVCLVSAAAAFAVAFFLFRKRRNERNG